jgi:hypothetical protein
MRMKVRKDPLESSQNAKEEDGVVYIHADNGVLETSIITPSLASPTSPSTENEDNILLEDDDEKKVLRAMELAMLDHKDNKAEGKESGSLFTTLGVWHHLGAMFPGKE